MKNTMNWNFDNSYSRLSNVFKEHIEPVAVKKPELVLMNQDLANELNLDFSKIGKNELSALFTGNILPKGSSSIAQAYAGHQFGHFTMLGDGRAVLIGEHLTNDNKRYDIQFKGSGKTAFSRNGDGRAALGPMLREYIISEAMHYLNIPTTRSLAVIKTGEKVKRETELDGAILTRVATSHIRVGTFQYFAFKKDETSLKNLINYTINKHFPSLKNENNIYLNLIDELVDKQIDLIVNWMRVGFIHGVMNTDNMSISGETIDYGPCAFLNNYNPKTVFSSIDKHGRYAFGNQHKIVYWNLSVFAGTILPLIDTDQDRAIDLAQNVLDQYPIEYSKKWVKMMGNKLGISNPVEEDQNLISNLLKLMESYKADYTNTFSALTMDKSTEDSLSKSEEFKNWKKQWKQRVENNEDHLKIMEENNPIFIPRNHLVESALKDAINGNRIKFDDLLKNMSSTYNYNLNHNVFQITPKGFDETYKTFCGT